MDNKEMEGWSRRKFLGGLAMAGAAAALGLLPEPAASAIEPPPETTRLRIHKGDPACWAPMYVAEPLLRKEGFTDIEYVFANGSEVAKMCREGAMDLSAGFSVRFMYNLEQQQHPLKIISGLHVGCYALVGSDTGPFRAGPQGQDRLGRGAQERGAAPLFHRDRGVCGA